MDADIVLWLIGCRGQERDWDGRCIGAENSRLGFYAPIEGSLSLFCDLRLQVGVFEHGFHDQIGAFDGGIIWRGGNQIEQALRLVLRHLVACHGLLYQVFAVRLALVSGRLIAVEKNGLNARERADIGYTGPHHARTDDGNLRKFGLRHACWTA